MQCAEYPLTVKSQIGGVLRPGCTRLQTPVTKNDIAQTTPFSPSFSTGTTSLSNWLAEHPQAVFVPPAEGHDFREAHVFDVSPKFWHDLTPRATRNLLSPVANPEDTVIDCKRSVRFVACTPYVGRCRRPRLRRRCAPTYRTYCVHSYCNIFGFKCSPEMCRTRNPPGVLRSHAQLLGGGRDTATNLRLLRRGWLERGASPKKKPEVLGRAQGAGGKDDQLLGVQERA